MSKNKLIEELKNIKDDLVKTKDDLEKTKELLKITTAVIKNGAYMTTKTKRWEYEIITTIYFINSFGELKHCEIISNYLSGKMSKINITNNLIILENEGKEIFVINKKEAKVYTKKDLDSSNSITKEFKDAIKKENEKNGTRKQ